MPRIYFLFLFLLLQIFPMSSVYSQAIIVQPYLEKATTSGIHISWETDDNGEALAEWGLDDQLGNETTAASFFTFLPGYRHEVQLNGLEAATNYYYRVRTGETVSAIFQFRTPNTQDAEESLRLVAISDMQNDGGNPNIFNQIVNDGIIPLIEDSGENLHDGLDMVLIPGDLVDNGLDYAQWNETFFDPAFPLFAQVPLYPVPGNHEVNSIFFFDYFHLPENGIDGLEEHSWYKDQSNVRIIGLDSNWPYADNEQLAWLQDVLEDACNNDQIDFVFAQLHHPHKSELWIDGNTVFTGSVILLLEEFSTDCGKPSIHFFGHTHGYSRGQSIEHSHLMVNVATSGGNIDYWGEYAQIDYPEFTVSQDEYGFVLVETEAGDDPKFVVKRYGQGDEFSPVATELRDSITVLKNNISPNEPLPIFPIDELVSPDCVVLVGNLYNDAENHGHMASQWQVFESCDTLDNAIYEAYRTHENWYFEIDTQADDDLTDELVSGLDEFTEYCWHVRYRDHSLGWSSWSSFATFETGESILSENLVLNPGAENGTAEWTVTEGYLESLTAGECAGTDPFNGTYYFGLGALCQENEFGEAWQDIDLSMYADEIDDGTAMAFYGAQLSDWNGSDTPEIQLMFLDQSNNELGSSLALSSNIPSWTLKNASAIIPTGTTKVRYFLRGYRFAGTDNDSYIDDIFLRINPFGCGEVTDVAEGLTADDSIWRISPNPLTKTSHLELPMDIDHMSLKVYDQTGRLVLDKGHQHGNLFAIGKYSFDAGNYVMVVSAKQQMRAIRFIVVE